ncbi:MAG: rod shape-determining protein MreD [Planctomycetota bacterium]|jgi:rod shape-determining protein MreD
MRWLRFAVLILVVTVLQAGVLANFRIRPDLLLVLLVFYATCCNTSEAIITSFTIGFAADITVIGRAMGPQIISFGLFGTLLAYLHRYIAIRRISYRALAILIVGVLAGVLANLLTALRGEPITPGAFRAVIWTSLYSGLVGPFLFAPFAWWMRIRTRRSARY